LILPERSCLYDIVFVAEAAVSDSDTSCFLQRCQALAAAIEDGGRAHSDSAIVVYLSLPLNWRRLDASWPHAAGAKWRSFRGLGKESQREIVAEATLRRQCDQGDSATHLAVLTRIPKCRKMLLNPTYQGD
jgi:hypothetical protein